MTITIPLKLEVIKWLNGFQFRSSQHEAGSMVGIDASIVFEITNLLKKK